MDERVLKIITVACGMLSLVVCTAFYFFPDIHAHAVQVQEERAAEEAAAAVFTEIDSQIDPVPDEAVDADQGMPGQLRIQLPEDLNQEDITIENDYLNQTVYVRFPDGIKDYFSKYRMQGSCDHIQQLSYYCEEGYGVISLGLDSVYELRQEYEGDSLYLSFLNPHDVYDKVVVVDAGHGGRASGAVKLGISEKDIDLKIVLELQRIMEENAENIGVYYTRTDDSNPTLDQRVRLANKVKADLFVSVHNNASRNGNFSSLNGTQVLYNEEDETGLSKAFAQICLDEVTEAAESRKIGLLEGSGIYIIRNSEVPAALIEVGFMTNREELEKLNTQEYQQIAAEGIYQAILQAFEKGY